MFGVKDTGSTYIHVAWDLSVTVEDIDYFKVSHVLSFERVDINIHQKYQQNEQYQN